MKKLWLSIALVLLLATAAFAKVNINTADAKELAALPGIGPAKAEAIVAYRQANGNFKSAQDLLKVKGLGDKLVEKITPEITFGK